MFTTADIVAEAISIRNQYKEKLDFPHNQIDDGLFPIPPYWPENADVRLFIVGQDPTIRNKSERSKIRCTLNLDKPGPLKKYIDFILAELSFSSNQFYATNLYKYFYSEPPAETIDVLKQHFPQNIKLIRKELDLFPNAIVITLGEPLLNLIVHENRESNNRMTHYWDYDFQEKITNGNFRFLSKKDNYLNRDVFPLPHQPSISKAFYKMTIKRYLDFVKQNA